jgi:hypothetical protein
MRIAWFFWHGAAFCAALAILGAAPLRAADEGSVHYVAEELGSRTKAPESAPSASKGLSDSAVRVMSTFALSILPDEVPDPSGEMIKLDKSDPNKYLIPLDDARRVIRVATRSAYAEVCKLYDLEKANYDAMIRTERQRAWTAEQMMFMHALHTFATSYFAGNVKITEEAADGAKPDSMAKEGAAAANNASGAATTINSKKLDCPAGQKEKVTTAINAYVQAAPPPDSAAAAAPPAAAAASQAAPPPAPMAGGTN